MVVRQQHLYVLGICGTFMASLAMLAKEKGYRVTGVDENIYPPMSDQLEQAGIEFFQGYDAAHLAMMQPDLIVVGNVIKRGNVEMEAVLNQDLPYVSGPQFLADHVLSGRHVIVVSGTHGKTTTSAMLSWVLESAGLNPGFLVGGLVENFGISARLGQGDLFVIEGDEYDCAFFDKRSKFLWYRPRTLILNNLEFDHADIFESLDAIKRQFHHLVRTVPSNGLIVCNGQDDNLKQVLEMGCWTNVLRFDDPKGLHALSIENAGHEFDVYEGEQFKGSINWSLIGAHNIQNALAVIQVALSLGLSMEAIQKGLASFKNVKRRMELKSEAGGVSIYSDFAHHPTAIQTTLAGLRQAVGQDRIIAVLELGSYTMRSGCHGERLGQSLEAADYVFVKVPDQAVWNVEAAFKAALHKTRCFKTQEDLISALRQFTLKNDHIIVMSNTGFEKIYKALVPVA